MVVMVVAVTVAGYRRGHLGSATPTHHMHQRCHRNGGAVMRGRAPTCKAYARCGHVCEERPRRPNFKPSVRKQGRTQLVQD